jgi:CubicO group peptidase (beta-lactamase class C family)
VAHGGTLTAVIRTGAALTVETSGVANEASDASIGRDTVFYVGSIAKQFVAACALLAIDDGLLASDTVVGDLMPDLPPWASDVHVRHLVHHTSGVTDRDFSDFPGVPIVGVPGWGNDDLLAEIRAIDALAFEPGSRYTYSNRGYHLLGQTIAAAAGRSLAALAEERIFGPLGMTATFFRDAPSELPLTAARGHFVALDGRTYIEPAAFHAVGAGGLWTTIDDLMRWDTASYDESSVASRLATRGALDDGTPIHYGWGLSVRTHRGLPIHSHGGSFPGWAAKMVRFPAQRTTVAILANHERGDVSSEAFVLADRLLAGQLDPGARHADDTFDGLA